MASGILRPWHNFKKNIIQTVVLIGITEVKTGGSPGPR